jgi:hypothetical protein
MKPLQIRLPEVEVRAGKRSWVIDLIAEAVKKSKKNRTVREARGFFALETSIDQTKPLEVIEAFYQCKSEPRKGITGIELKNGRFGLSEIENFWFINKNPTTIIQNLSVFWKTDFHLPLSPFAMDGKEMKRAFRFRIDTLIQSGKSVVACINFTPKTNPGGYFSGSVYIDTATFEIQKMNLNCPGARVHPFHPLDSTHRISHVDFQFVVVFKNIGKGKPVHDYIRFDYQMEYLTKQKAYTISSKSILALYDYNSGFSLPYCIGAPDLSDYGKILSFPYNKLFWQRNYIIPATETALDYTRYFEQNGISVNYGESNAGVAFIPRPVLYWSPDVRLAWNSIGKNNPGWIHFAGSKRKKPDKEEVLSRKYFLDFQVFLDFNPEPDTCYYQSKAMLFLDNSFYEPERDSMALKAIELEFEITELYRLRLEHRLDSVLSFGCDPKQVLNVYDKLVKQFEGMRWLYRKEVKRGQNQIAYETWKRRIDLRLQRARSSHRD